MDIIGQIFELFTNGEFLFELKEDYHDVKAEYKGMYFKIPMEEEFNKVISSLNRRDNIHISCQHNNETYCSYFPGGENSFSDFLQEYSLLAESVKEEQIVISVTIIKNEEDGVISVYYIDKFIEYLNSQVILGLLLIFNKGFCHHNFLVFEVQDSFFKEISTKTIKFIPQGACVLKEKIAIREERNNKIKNLCFCPIIPQYQFIPDDFFITEGDNLELKKIFDKLVTIYSVMFLFDIFSIKETNIEYKLNGYRAIDQKVAVLAIDFDSCRTYYEIYSWVYEGGNVVDKIGLARNILSLNFERDTLRLSDTTFEAIKSAYKIYQRENIRQYIDVRNKITEQLIEFQGKADKIVEKFISDYKKSLFTIVSFFISVIIIRVVSKGDFIGSFTPEVTVLSLGFLLVAFLLMIFARWEVNKQISRCEELYIHVKNRYQDLLTEEDINKILNNDKDFNSNIGFIKERRNKYTILWCASLFILFVVTIILFHINHSYVLIESIYNLIKTTIACFIKNILQ